MISTKIELSCIFYTTPNMFILFWTSRTRNTTFRGINWAREFQPDIIQFADALPKTRSGKIMRRILKAIVSKTDIGNVTTLADPSVVDTFIEVILK